VHLGPAPERRIYAAAKIQRRFLPDKSGAPFALSIRSWGNAKICSRGNHGWRLFCPHGYQDVFNNVCIQTHTSQKRPTGSSL